MFVYKPHPLHDWAWSSSKRMRNMLASSPGPFPAFQCYTLKSGNGPGDEATICSDPVSEIIRQSMSFMVFGSMAKAHVCFVFICASLSFTQSHSIPPAELLFPFSDTQSSSSSNPAPAPVPAKRYTVNLDLPPEQRWTEVVKDHEESIIRLIQSMKQALPAELASLVATLGEDIDKYMPYPYGQEIVGISNTLTNTTVSDAVLGNILYELTAYGNQNIGVESKGVKMCTSIVAQTLNGSIYHGRNLDYSFPDLLRDMTVIVDFQQGGQTVYTGTTFAGLIGLATAQKPHAYTISVNERDAGTWWMNAFEALLAGTHGITFLLVRDAVSDKEMDFESAVNSLTSSRLIAPSYIIVGGVKPGEGVVITRDRTAAKDLWQMDPDNGHWYLVETNYDHWLPPPAGDNRRDPAIKAMDGTTRAGLNNTSLFKVLSTPPMLNSGTTYTATMSAAMPDIYNTWIRSDA